MIIHEKVIQGSDAWFALRRGRPTASRFKDIITAQKGDLSKSSPAYIAELIGECFVPDWIDFAGNKFTDRGTELEPVARKAFEEHTGDKTTEVGFVTRADEVVGCSPDGLVLHLGKNLERDAVYDKHNRITTEVSFFAGAWRSNAPRPKFTLAGSWQVDCRTSTNNRCMAAWQ